MRCTPSGTRSTLRSRLTDDELTRAIHEARRNHDLADRGLARLYALCPRAAAVFDSKEAPSRSIFQHTFKAFLSCAVIRSRCSKPTGTDIRSTPTTQTTR